jgi:uncharacterized protein (DUF488 family)
MKRIYTIGHSTRTLDELVALLRDHGVTRLADIRRYPGSRRHPQFSRDALELSLPTLDIVYEHFADLGGRRSPRKDSENMAWENPQFRGYADHMSSDAFQSAVDRLLAAEAATVVMCAEAVPWRCHRNLLADELVRRGVEAVHIIGPGKVQVHELSEMARIENGRVVYPLPQRRMFP